MKIVPDCRWKIPLNTSLSAQLPCPTGHYLSIMDFIYLKFGIDQGTYLLLGIHVCLNKKKKIREAPSPPSPLPPTFQFLETILYLVFICYSQNTKLMLKLLKQQNEEIFKLFSNILKICIRNSKYPNIQISKYPNKISKYPNKISKYLNIQIFK